MNEISHFKSGVCLAWSRCTYDNGLLEFSMWCHSHNSPSLGLLFYGTYRRRKKWWHFYNSFRFSIGWKPQTERRLFNRTCVWFDHLYDRWCPNKAESWGQCLFMWRRGHSDWGVELDALSLLQVLSHPEEQLARERGREWGLLIPAYISPKQTQRAWV